MRIIGGTLRGRQIRVPRHFRGRPTTDFAREGLFNILRSQQLPEGCRVLDLFAGTGAFSLECLSRGAEKATAVELAVPHVKAIRENFDQFGFHQSEVIRAEVIQWLKQATGSYDLVFADPPFAMENLEALPGKILTLPGLLPGALIILEHSDKLSFEGQPGFERERRYGQVVFSFFRHSQT